MTSYFSSLRVTNFNPLWPDSASGSNTLRDHYDASVPRPNLPGWLQNALLALLAVAVLGGAVAVLHKDRSVRGAGLSAPLPPLPTASAGAGPITAVFFGDSIVAGANTTSSDKTFTAVASAELGWQQSPFGYPGSGFTTPGSYQGGKTYLQRAEGLHGYTSNVIVVEGGLNDSAADAQTLRAAIEVFLGRVRELVPSATVVLMGPWSPTDKTITSSVRTDQTMKALAKEQGLPYVSPISERWITGTYPTSGNAKVFISSDGFYPNDAGHAYFGHRLAQDLKRLLPARLTAG